MSPADAARLSSVREALGLAGAQLILASTTGFDGRIPRDVLAIGLTDIYG